VDQPLAQRILNLVYQNPGVQRVYKEALTNWILDTQPRTAPLGTAALVEYLSAYHPDLLARLKSNVRIKEDLDRALDAVERN
jgi:hypothetical protein